MVILVTPSEAAAFAATSTSSAAAAVAATSLSTPAAAAESVVINNAPAEQNSTELQTKLFNSTSCSKPAQHTSPGGLVQLCRHKECFNAVDFERGGGLCCVHQKNQKGPMDGEQNDSEDSADDGKIRGVTSDEGLSDTYSTHDNNHGLDNEVGKKRALTSGDSISGKDDIKRQRVDAFVLDLTGVPPQSPIPKSAGHIKEGASKYKGVHFNKLMKKWHAQIYIEGKVRLIGYYDNEEEAAVDYARAVFKYKNQAALGKAREQDSFIIDLSDVPPQSPISKSEGRIKEGASKYTGVSFDKRMNKWQAKIYIEGKVRLIGYYDNEEEAAVDYARAVFKYKNQGALGKAREDSFIIDLSDVPPQPPIPQSAGTIKEGASKYTGVHFNKQMNKWRVQIDIKGKNRTIGYYENEEEAGVDYARAVFKYKGQGALGKAREQDSFIIDLSDVPRQSPIPKSSDYAIKEGASKYIGATFNKQKNKWQAQITIEGKNRTIGYYENEEEAATDYARAVFKYKGQGALDKARERRARDKSRERNSFIIELTDVPPRSPITKSAGLIKEGASKYAGVSFNKSTKKWLAKIGIDGKQRYIGSYENEEAAAVDYARAVFKYRGQFGTESQSGRNN
ncbi:putative AP2/ERF family transcription factor family protein [Skeletonema marinoi]|uniref:AP2/ERF family transcription factor family protein n=1 Tax=Skeletonema marinoi TaxID=267567 RepID=A0AAD8Y548_9STRA|nr:putative AP2/ERF family transcription factor family protein [Skeletonema marinoi]